MMSMDSVRRASLAVREMASYSGAFEAANKLRLMEVLKVLHDATFLVGRLEGAERALQAKQAQIDALMLEFCPEDMTEAQIKEWIKHQRVSRQPKRSLGLTSRRMEPEDEPKLKCVDDACDPLCGFPVAQFK